jgi:hypothetical protein
MTSYGHRWMAIRGDDEGLLCVCVCVCVNRGGSTALRSRSSTSAVRSTLLSELQFAWPADTPE